MRSKDGDDTFAKLRKRYARALGFSGAAFASLAGCASAEKDFVAVPMSAPPIDAGIDAADLDAGPADDAGRHATRALHEPANRDRCTRVVRCRAEDDEPLALPYPEPFSKCAPTFAKTEHQAQFSPKETTTARGDGEGVCCYVEFKDCRQVQQQIMRGRALRIAGKVHASKIAFQAGFSARNTSRASRVHGSAQPLRQPHSSRARARLAARWARDASLEHASIASFERLALSLAALGADASLVLACRRAARDEVRHTRDACALASAYARRDVTTCAPAVAIDRNLPDLTTLAHETLLDGCIGETVAALVAARELRACKDAGVARVLTRVARDEARHAELAFRILAWAVARAGDTLARAIEREALSLTRVSPENFQANGDHDLAQHGDISAHEKADVMNRATFDVALPLVLAITRARDQRPSRRHEAAAPP